MKKMRIEPLQHTACEACGSSDAGQIYDDGHFHCHKCGAHTVKLNVDGTIPYETYKKGHEYLNNCSHDKCDTAFLQGDYRALTARNISRETCELFHYKHSEYYGKPCTVSDIFDPKSGQLVAQKIRLEGKEFPWIGDNKKGGLFGQQRFGKGKRIVITEGFEDAMAVSEVFNNKWPVVSIINGADLKGTGPKNELVRQIEYLNNFDEIVLLFDMDEPGQICAIEAAKVLPMGKTFIATISEHDACDMLKAGKGQELFASVFNAKPYVPDGLIDKIDLLESVFKIRELSKITYPFPRLNSMTFGIRAQEIITIAGGSGLGKSTFVRQIANNLIDQKEKVGFITLEEDAEFTLRCLVGQRLKKNTRLIPDLNKISDVRQMIQNDILPYTEWYDDQGGLTKARLKATIEFMALAQGCKWIVYDHITMTDKSEGDTMVEAIDSVMKILRSMAQKYKITIFVVTQLAKPSEGKGYNEGREVKLSNIRGSAAIEFNSNLIIAFQGDNREGGCQRDLVVLKNRYYGVNTGHADILTYSPETDMLTTGVNVGEF
jgi:twinkle protein